MYTRIYFSSRLNTVVYLDCDFIKRNIYHE
nr:MAG TPA: hypothetical protein [Caudoviricetes sp.]